MIRVLSSGSFSITPSNSSSVMRHSSTCGVLNSVSNSLMLVVVGAMSWLAPTPGHRGIQAVVLVLAPIYTIILGATYIIFFLLFFNMDGVTPLSLLSRKSRDFNNLLEIVKDQVFVPTSFLHNSSLSLEEAVFSWLDVRI